MAIPGEKTVRELDWDENGQTGKLVYLCPWSMVDPLVDPALPFVGDCWGGRDNPREATQPWLRFQKAHAQEDPKGSGLCEYTAEFSTQGDLTAGEGGEAFYSMSMEPGQFKMPDLSGYYWVGLGTPVVGTLPDPSGRPAGIEMRVLERPYTAILAAEWCVNDRVFQGAAIGTLLYCGASIDESYGIPRGETALRVTSARVNHKWLWRDRDHRYFWRPPVQMRHVLPPFEPLIWQNTHPTCIGYITDHPEMAGSPMYYPGRLDNTSTLYVEPTDQGVGAWDCPFYIDPVTLETKYIYGSCDFSTVLGIPPLPTDDAPG